MKFDTVFESITMNLDIVIGSGAIFLFVIIYRRVTTNKTQNLKKKSINSGHNSTNIQADGDVKIQIGKNNEK